MHFKPFAFSAILSIGAETVAHKEQTPHPVHEHIHQDQVTGRVNVYQISGSTILSSFQFTDASFATLATKKDV